MQVSITARHFDLTEGLKEHTEERLGKLTKYGVPLIEAHAVLMVEKYRHSAEITLHGNGVNISGSSESDDMYTSVDQVAHKLEEQIRRYKDKAHSHKMKESRRNARMNVIRSGGGGMDVVDSNELVIPVMTVEEAILDLERGNDDYLMFTNAVTDKVNIVSRMEDGNYGVVEP